ncbi:MAG: mucoidy inhibitor MuiA family protein [Polyangia bacterium]
MRESRPGSAAVSGTNPAARPQADRDRRVQQRRRRWLVPCLLWVGGTALLEVAPGFTVRGVAAATEPKVQTVEAPITAVTVYSDRARVTRTVRVATGGGPRVQLPILVGSIDPASIRVEVQGAGEVAVQGVEIGYVEASELPLPVSEAEKLLTELDHLDDQIAQVQSEQAAYGAQARLLGRVLPSTNGLGQATPGGAPPPRLNPTGWTAVFQFVRQALERVHVKSRELDEQLRTLRLKRRELIDKGHKLGGLVRRAGYRVTATLSGSGTAQLALSYIAHGARWLPTYDIQLQPAQNRVELSLAGLVSQQTGEDWTDAALTLSTAVPATATQLPKLQSWRLGERERFIPTPAPQAESVRPPPPAPPPVRVADADAGEAVRQRLLSRLGLPGGAIAGEDGTEIADEFRPSGGIQREVTKKEAPAKAVYNFDSDELSGNLIRPQVQKTPAAPAAPPPPPAEPAPVVPEAIEELAQTVTVTGSTDSLRLSGRRGPSRSAPIDIVGIGLSPPPGYTPPSYDPSLPASLAGGYDLVYTGLYRDTVKSGQGARRVALLSRSFPVTVSRKLFPALAPEAFLVAEIKNPGREPLPGGQANLFVGEDPAGVAQLRLIAPGEVFTLPLGLDRAVRPVRNVQVTTVEKGVFSKDEISEYVVTTEVANPYRVAVDLRLHDQIPIIGDKNVEIRLVRTDPQAQLDEKKGALDWRLVVPPGAKVTTTFVYSLRRPKGYRLNQAQY